MTKKIIITLSVLIIILLTITTGNHIYAAPLLNYPCTITQPDGTELECYLNGDEYFAYLTDSNGAIIVQNPTTEEYTYAEFTNGELRHTTNVVGKTYGPIQGGSGGGGSVPSVSISNVSETYITNMIQQKKTARCENNDFETLNLVENNYSTMDFRGKILNNIVIFVEFSDTVFSHAHKSLEYYDGLFNSNDKSVQNFYNEVSYGQTTVNSVFATPSTSDTALVYKSSNPRSYYEADYDLLYELMGEAVNWAKTNGYVSNDLNFDTNGDGEIDCVTFIFAGDVQNYGNYIFWPQAWWSGYINETIQGKSINNFLIIPEKALYNTNTGYLFQRNEAILCHESFHAIFGGRDLYDDSRGKSWNRTYGVCENAVPMRNWDLMSSSPGAHVSSYMKYRYGSWITIPEITDSGTYTLKPLKTTNNSIPAGIINDTVAYVLRSSIPVSGEDDVSQYFIVEYRKHSGCFETSSNLQDTGLVVYRVNSNFNNRGNNCNGTDSNNSKYEIEEIYPKSSSLNLKYSNDTSSGITLSNVVENSNGTLTFNVTMPTSKNLFYFKDARLAEAVRTAIGKTTEQITISDIATLTTLNVSIDNSGLPLDLQGIEYLTGLTSFTAVGCKIDDITPLQSLINLTYLDLTDNNIKDISALSGLTQLDTLKLRGNLIEDYTPTESFYNNLSTKDFSITNKDDFIFRIKEIGTTGVLNAVYITVGQYLPQKVYLTAELYSSDDVLQQKTKEIIYTSLATTEISLNMPSGYVCNKNGSYVVLSLFERYDEQQLLSRIEIKPSFFDLSEFRP